MVSSLITMITPFSCAQSAPKETVVFRGNWFKVLRKGRSRARPSSRTLPGRNSREISSVRRDERGRVARARTLIEIMAFAGKNFLDRIDRNRKREEEEGREKKRPERDCASVLSRLIKVDYGHFIAICLTLSRKSDRDLLKSADRLGERMAGGETRAIRSTCRESH